MTRTTLILAVAASIAFGFATTSPAATGDPLPGIDVLVRKKPGDKPTRAEFGSSDLPAIPADFFGPGSDPFTGTVFLEWIDPDSDADTIDLDFVEGASPNVFDVELEEMTLTSVEPIDVGGGAFYDVEYQISADGLPPGEPVIGTLELPSGAVLDPGTTYPIVDMFFDIAYTIEFSEAGTGNPAGTPISGTTTLAAVDVEKFVERETYGQQPAKVRGGIAPRSPLSFESAGGGHVLTIYNVPEPASALLAIMGGLALLFVKRRK